MSMDSSSSLRSPPVNLGQGEINNILIRQNVEEAKKFIGEDPDNEVLRHVKKFIYDDEHNNLGTEMLEYIIELFLPGISIERIKSEFRYKIKNPKCAYGMAYNSDMYHYDENGDRVGLDENYKGIPIDSFQGEVFGVYDPKESEEFDVLCFLLSEENEFWKTKKWVYQGMIDKPNRDKSEKVEDLVRFAKFIEPNWGSKYFLQINIDLLFKSKSNFFVAIPSGHKWYDRNGRFASVYHNEDKGGDDIYVIVPIDLMKPVIPSYLNITEEEREELYLPPDIGVD